MIPSGTWCTINHNIKIGDLLAFKKDEVVLVEAISPDSQRPENQYVVRSDGFGKTFLLCEDDLQVVSYPVPAPPQTQPFTGIEDQPDSSAGALGFIMAVIPLCSAIIAWFWISNMTLLEGPASKLAGLAVVTVLATAILGALEAQRLGFEPIQWFFFIALLWIVGYPYYLWERGRHGQRNLLVMGIIVAVIFIATVALLGVAIQQTRSDFLNTIKSL